jgi:hypothetical protein
MDLALAFLMIGFPLVGHAKVVTGRGTMMPKIDLLGKNLF